jgi:hypothetical protein
LFLQQWDDELFSRDDCLALFDLLASEDKTLHANPGGHLGVPPLNSAARSTSSDGASAATTAAATTAAAGTRGARSR